MTLSRISGCGELEDALRARYRDRPDTLAAVLANAEAWQRAEDGGRRRDEDNSTNRNGGLTMGLRDVIAGLPGVGRPIRVTRTAPARPEPVEPAEPARGPEREAPAEQPTKEPVPA